MPLEGKVGSYSVRVSNVVTHDHPPVLSVLLFKPFDKGGYEAGLVMALDEEGFLTPWEGAVDIVGVLAERHGPDDKQTALVLIHGTAMLGGLHKKDGARLVAADVHALALAGIYGV